MNGKGRKLFRSAVGILTSVMMMGAYTTTAMASGNGVIDAKDMLDIHAEANRASAVVGQVMEDGHVAILAKYYGIPFYSLGPTSTIDRSCATGADICIEQRPASEIREKFYREPMALPEVKCYNPAFDVTEHTLVSGIVTEKGICLPPFTESLPKLFEGTDCGSLEIGRG